MKVRLSVPDNPVVWQCLYHALLDFCDDQKMKTTYTFEIPEGECEVEIRKPNEEVNVFWNVK